ncbi:testis-expressed protein 2-like [Bombina bombina]|uniref:testis-expressed protein 2-like n=1 Tax=Bombina bombina TaxID=8345 RepID=UPI00235A8A09|nr:testis-expressed protein 2-like [Bombina bombina]
MSDPSEVSAVEEGSPSVNSSITCSTQVDNLPYVPQAITIQLTKVHSEENWENLDESELIFTLDQDDDAGSGSIVEKPVSPAHFHSAGHSGIVVNELALAAYECVGDVLLCNETQRCLSPLFPSSPTSKPLINLVKSVSTEIESKDPSPHKPHPLVNLVKSISTEISRLEPEVTQSKSDSKLNVHLWRQITQPKNKNGDSRTAPSSPSMSPSESKGMFFNVQDVEAKLEDTKRRLSEAMQEPLSMLSKIIGDEPSSSSRYRTNSPVVLAQESPTSQRDQVLFDARNTLSIYRRNEEAESLVFTESTTKPVHKDSLKNYCNYEICSYGDVIQVVELSTNDSSEVDSPGANLQPPLHRSDVPCSALACVAILTYNFFIWPLPSYISGLLLGLASGFLLGFFLILLFVPKTTYSTRHARFVQEKLKSSLATPKPQEPDIMKGWMNEMFSYDPETYHPAFTHSVFVTLEGTSIKRSYPKNNLPRRSIFGEEIPDIVFINHQVNDLTNAEVFLYPYGLARKRLWNKKYPICIQLSDTEELVSPSLELCETEDVGEEALKLNPENTQKLPGDCKTETLYLFGRTGREKEEWYQHLVKASRGLTNGQGNTSRCESKAGFVPNTHSSPSSWGGPSNCSGESTEENPCQFRPKDLVGNVKQKILLDYTSYMGHFIPPEQISPLLSPCQSEASSPTPRKKYQVERSPVSNSQLNWINVLIGRIFWDFLREKYWEDMVANKIQKKLSKIKLPHFMNELTLKDLDLGTSLPQVLSNSAPTMNERGLWMDMEVAYLGSLQVTLETKMNLSKLGKEILEERGQTEDRREGPRTSRTRILADSDEESSSAGSSEDEEIPITEVPGIMGERPSPANVECFTGGSSTGRRILRFVDKIAKSRYFQKATENEYIKRKIEEVSNTPLLLTVEVQELEGTLVVNIPPPPTDSIWYSFRTPPRLEMKVRPKLGEREVTFIHVTEWIEKKLQDEFQKVLVMPNMDDLYFPIMKSSVENPQA